jgi:methylenetetrahydrofolate--tRNA-(uracil-5-)-methyltransferase
VEKEARKITIIGGGLAGCEGAWQLAEAGIPVTLYEMRPEKMTPAHESDLLGELVCSNSLGSNLLTNAVGILKEELRKMNSLIIQAADEGRVPAGKALAVDRMNFSQFITKTITSHPNIKLIREEVTHIPEEGIVIVASGPLTSDTLSKKLMELTGEEYMYFYDATSPIVTRESVNEEAGFWGSRYDEDGTDYFNAPMTQEEYDAFYNALITAELHKSHEWEEKEIFFEECMPIDEIACRGKDTLRFGPLKPVGLINPKTGHRPWAVIQLRKEDAEGNLLNLVGFQTSLKWGEQERVFKMIPALKGAEFVRFGTIHRNTYINSPKLLTPSLQLKENPRIFFAGQITGVDGYIESTGMGLVAGINAERITNGLEPIAFPAETVIGSLLKFISGAETKNFQPMNANFGLLPPLTERIRDKKARRQAIAERALTALEKINLKMI